MSKNKNNDVSKDPPIPEWGDSKRVDPGKEGRFLSCSPS